jgi:hypothetical protein
MLKFTGLERLYVLGWLNDWLGLDPISFRGFVLFILDACTRW